MILEEAKLIAATAYGANTQEMLASSSSHHQYFISDTIRKHSYALTDYANTTYMSKIQSAVFTAYSITSGGPWEPCATEFRIRFMSASSIQSLLFIALNTIISKLQLVPIPYDLMYNIQTTYYYMSTPTHLSYSMGLKTHTIPDKVRQDMYQQAQNIILKTREMFHYATIYLPWIEYIDNNTCQITKEKNALSLFIDIPETIDTADDQDMTIPYLPLTPFSVPVTILYFMTRRKTSIRIVDSYLSSCIVKHPEYILFSTIILNVYATNILWQVITEMLKMKMSSTVQAYYQDLQTKVKQRAQELYNKASDMANALNRLPPYTIITNEMAHHIEGLADIPKTKGLLYTEDQKILSNLHQKANDDRS